MRPGIQQEAVAKKNWRNVIGTFVGRYITFQEVALMQGCYAQFAVQRRDMGPVREAKHSSDTIISSNSKHSK